MEQVFLSIDWDFFVRMPDPSGSTETSKGTVKNWILYDWGASEDGVIAAIQNHLWEIRRMTLQEIGVDIENEVTLGETSPDDVLNRFNLGGAVDRRFMVSHAWAIQHLVDLADQGPFHVVNLDAHHDLGYSDRQLRAAKNGQVDCGSWLYAALHHELASSATVVFPDWLEDQEIPDQDFDVDVVTFRDMPDFSDREIAGVFIARSDSWAPPYLDGEFMEMCTKAGFDPERFDGELIRPWNTTQRSKN